MTGHLRSLWFALVLVSSCGGDGGTEAQRRGVGSGCASDTECTETAQRCLTQFKGGYCGVVGCMDDAGCPAGSACVTHDDGMNYCFLVCAAKEDCNRYRSAAIEANCSSTAMFVGGTKGRKACTPPSGT